MPPRGTLFESDLDMPQQGDAEFIDKCRIVHKKINRMIQKPHLYYHEAEGFVRCILRMACEIQNCYEIESQTLVNEFIMAVKLQAHIIFLLSMLSHAYTGRRTSLITIKNQLENIWKAAALTNNHELIKKCHDSISNPSESIYDTFQSSLCQVEFPRNLIAKVNKKTGEITFPVGEKVINECDVLSVQGHGSKNLYCIVELPDGSIESAKASSHSNHLNSYIRIHRPNNLVCVQICFAVLLNLTDFLNGPGLHHETLKLTSYIPVSNYVSLMLKPSNNLL